MRTTTPEGVELAYDVTGSGEPVVLIHGAHVADAYQPLVDRPELSKYQLIRYHRRGLGESSRATGPVTIEDQAGDCVALMRHLGLGSAHVAGHSLGGVIALQLALDAPDLVHSLALLEPALLMVPSAQTFMEQAAPVFAAYERGDKGFAVEMFIQAVGRPNAREIVESAIPGGFDQAIRDADTFFTIEVPSLQAWKFDADAAQRITQPVLYMLSEDALPLFVEARALAHEWLPQTEDVLVPGACHLLQMENAQPIAAGLAAFFEAHPLTVPAPSR
jgi:pimeloyl-ACP methyl ester carboxylesterase